MFSNLKYELERKNITIKALAKLLDCSEKTAQNKLYGITEFTLSEILAISDNLLPEFNLRYLFNKAS